MATQSAGIVRLDVTGQQLEDEASAADVVANVAALQNLTPVENQIVRIAGARYLWVDGDTSTHTGVNVIESLVVGFRHTGPDAGEGNWILQGIELAVSGSESAPSLSFVGDPDTGIFHKQGNDMRFAAGGRDCMKVNLATSVGDITIGVLFDIDREELTIASDTVSPTKSWLWLTGEGTAADDLVTINNGADGRTMTLTNRMAAGNITVKRTGNIKTDTGADLVIEPNGITEIICWYNGVDAKWHAYKKTFS